MTNSEILEILAEAISSDGTLETFKEELKGCELDGTNIHYFELLGRLQNLNQGQSELANCLKLELNEVGTTLTIDKLNKKVIVEILGKVKTYELTKNKLNQAINSCFGI